MTEDRLPLAGLLAKAEDGDFLRGVAEAVLPGNSGGGGGDGDGDGAAAARRLQGRVRD